MRNNILQAASREFLAKGFKDASMRSISKQSGVTLSNIYNYFRNKDEIYCAVLKPLLLAFDKLLKKHNGADYLTSNVFTMKSYQQKMIDEFMDILKPYRAELNLLLFQSSGSSFENFRDTFTQQ